MKKKTFLRFLPALLVAPILACCVTVFATADEIEGQTFYEKLFSSVFQNNNGLDILADDHNAVSNGGHYTDGIWDFRVVDEETSSGSVESVAYIEGCSNKKQDTLVVPIWMTNEGTKYKVVGIDGNILSATTYTERVNGLHHLIISGYEYNEATGNVEGGWFKSIASSCCAYYYEEEVSGKYVGGGLVDVVLPDCLKSIGPSAFMNDSGLTNIYYQTNNYNIQNSDFEKVPGLPPSLTRLGNKCFMDCSALSFSEADNNLVIPDNVTSLEYTAFKNCHSLTSLIINSAILTGIDGAEASVEDKGGGAFEGCENLETIDLNNATGLKNFGVYAFKNCYKIKELILPNNVEKLGKQAFLNCYNIDNVKINESLQEIGEFCFANLTSTAATEISEGGTASQLEYVYLPEATKKIQQAAFQNNKNLKEVVVGMKTGAVVEEGNDLIADSAFANCPEMVSITFLWDVPWQLYDNSFKYSGSTGICAATPSIDVRFRPIDPSMAWLPPNYYKLKNLDNIFPVGSHLCITAIFCDDYYGNDLENYLEQNGCTQEEVEKTGAYDNETLLAYNENLNNISYKPAITIPDTVTIDEAYTTDKIMKSKTKGENSKTIDFIYDSTPIKQTTYTSSTPKEITREADDGILNIGNTAIQINVGSKDATTTLNVTRTDKNGTKTNPCIYGHGSTKLSNPFANTYEYLTADANLLENNSIEEGIVREPKLNEHEESDKPRGLFSANDDYDMEVNNACCIFCRSNANLNISDITFGGELYNPITEITTKTENICQLACIYNSGTMDMKNCSFENTTSTWSSEKDKRGKEISYGGSCVFNFGKSSSMTNCTMENCLANLDGGAVLNADELTITNCSFKNCKAKRFGGAVFDNLGDESKGGTGKYGKLTIDKCTFIENSSPYGGALHYRNAIKGTTMLTLKGTCTFSGNTDSKGITDDLCMGPDFSSDPTKPASTTEPFAIDGFSLSEGNDPLTISAIRAKVGFALCKDSNPSSLDLFKYKEDAYDFQVDDEGFIALKIMTTTYNLDSDENGHWVETVDEVEKEVTSFTAVGTTPPDAGETIVYEDADGNIHTLTAKATSEDYMFDTCTYDETSKTYTATFKAAEQNKNNLATKIKNSIESRNADAKENAKLEIYGK